MTGLTVKDVDFNGTTLRAAQDIDNVIWVGVSWVCNGIGFSKSKKDTQIQKIQSDSLLKRGCLKFQAGVFDDNNDTLALQLDYLPAWLFKINITPKMEREDPELADRLLQYQLKAKDVLAEAFLGKKKNEVIVPETHTQTIQLQMPRYDDKFAELNQKMDKLYSDIGMFARFMMDWKNAFDSLSANMYTANAVSQSMSNNILDESKIWKQKTYRNINKVLNTNNKFSDVAEVMRHIYDYMRQNYGIVWEQETREYIDRNNCTKKPSTIDIVYENDMYRSIFEAILADLINEDTVGTIKKNNTGNTDDIIKPLIEKLHDTSNAGMATYRIVYKHMDENYKIGWKNLEGRYVNKYGVKTLSKKNMINTSPTLMKKFKISVKVGHADKKLDCVVSDLL